MDLSMLRNANNDDIDKFNMGEDAPQIVGIIDDRPPELIAKEDYNKSRMWKTLGAEPEAGDNNVNQMKQRTRSKSPNHSKKREDESADASPVRRRIKNDGLNSRDISPPVRRERSPDASPRRKTDKHRDASPPRRRKRDDSSDASPRQRNKSPARKHNRRSGSRDESVPRRTEKGRDASPPRRRKVESTYDACSRRRERSPIRRNRSRSHDESPPTKTNQNRDASPPRRRKQNDNSDTSTHRQPTDFKQRNKQLSESPPPTHKKIIKTLDGKIAGLQSASALRDENEKFKKREEELYKHIAKNHPNDAEAQVRKTGRRRNLEQNSEKEMEKMRKADERKAVYDRWGKGIKQIEDFKERVAEEKHEQNKPLARYADDADLDDYLKQQFRSGDPMAEYFQSKSKEKGLGPCKYNLLRPTYNDLCLYNIPIYKKTNCKYLDMFHFSETNISRLFCGKSFQYTTRLSLGWS